MSEYGLEARKDGTMTQLLMLLFLGNTLKR